MYFPFFLIFPEVLYIPLCLCKKYNVFPLFKYSPKESALLRRDLKNVPDSSHLKQSGNIPTENEITKRASSSPFKNELNEYDL